MARPPIAEELTQMQQGRFYCKDDKYHDISKLLPGVVIGSCRHLRAWSARNTPGGDIYRQMLAIMTAELERRGLKEDNSEWFAMMNGSRPVSCHVTDCQNKARYSVGTFGYCGIHKGRALLLRRKVSAGHEKSNRRTIIERNGNAKDYASRAGSRLTWDGKGK